MSCLLNTSMGALVIHDLPVTKPPALPWEAWHPLSQSKRRKLSQQYYATLKPAALTLLAIKCAPDPLSAQRLLLGGPMRTHAAR